MVHDDTSVWVDFFKNRATPEVEHLADILEKEQDVFTTGMILQEVLGGIRQTSV